MARWSKNTCIKRAEHALSTRLSRYYHSDEVLFLEAGLVGDKIPHDVSQPLRPEGLTLHSYR